MIYEFGDCEDPLTVGGKGASLSRMKNLRLPVPEGFTVSTDAWQAHNTKEITFTKLMNQVKKAIDRFIPGFGEGTLISVRSGAPVSMPGMMDTILNIGIDLSNKEMSHDSALRAVDFLRSYARVTNTEITAGAYEEAIDKFIDDIARIDNVLWVKDLNVERLRMIIRLIARKIRESGVVVPRKPSTQLRHSMALVLASWSNERAKLYREQKGIPHDMGTAVNIQRMVFGQQGGAGVYLTRSPETGIKKPMVDWLPNAQGSEVVDGVSLVKGYPELKQKYPFCALQLEGAAKILERNGRDAQDIEFTIENGNLWLLQCRSIKRTSQATSRIAVELLRAGIITEEDIIRIPLPPTTTETTVITTGKELIGRATPVIKRAVRGKLYIIKNNITKPEETILFRPITTPADLDVMLQCKAIVTTLGGPTCHAALVSRELNIPTYVSASGSMKGSYYYGDKHKVVEGSDITITENGEIYRGLLTINSKTRSDKWRDEMSKIQQEAWQQSN
ncbi:MAG: PEP/pyruvate-binding domain-containing protein [Candidatus Poseidoniia archaeon]|jgi:pyruvate,orthophosphate dikinase|nr:PEP/pyruvate-binding domain-containing protein [Candidatus Poseidoniia archaeon]